MKAVVIEEIGRVVVKEVPMQVIGDYQALVKIEACSLCNGTEIKLLEGKIPWQVDYPGILGHESCGTIIETGKKVRNFKKGHRVLRVMASVPGYSSFWGGLAEYGAITDVKACKEDRVPPDPATSHQGQQVVPKEIDPVTATQLITLKETLSVLRKFKLKTGSSVLIMGTGPVGLSFIYLARKVIGASPVAALDKEDETLKRAPALGASFVVNSAKENATEELREFRGTGFDLIIDTTGSADLIRLGLENVSTNGKVEIYGTVNKDAEPVKPLKQDKRVVEIPPEEAVPHSEILKLIAGKTIDPSRLITHVLSIDDIAEAFDLIKSRKAIKVVLKI